MALIALAVFGLIVILMAAYGYRISAKTAEDYMLGGRTIGVVVMFFFVNQLKPCKTAFEIIGRSYSRRDHQI